MRRLVRANVHSAALVGGEDPQGAAGAVDRLILGAVPALRSGHGLSALGASSLVGGIIGQLGRPISAGANFWAWRLEARLAPRSPPRGFGRTSNRTDARLCPVGRREQ